jgi:solute carrier family 25 uncoupling protein 27
MLKTQLQLAGVQQHMATGSQRMGLVGIAASIIRNQGLAGLWLGIAPAVLRHVPYTGIRVMTFEQLRILAQQRWSANAATAGRQGPQLPLLVSLTIGLTAGGVAQLVAVPADLIKVRMQADARSVAMGVQAAPRWAGLLGDVAAAVSCVVLLHELNQHLSGEGV